MAITFFHRSTAVASGVHVATHEVQHSQTQGSSATTLVSAGHADGADTLAFLFSSTSLPDSFADWASGDYQCVIDCTVAGADMTYGLLTLGGSAGHFARINAARTSDLETRTQAEGAFSGTGLKTATTGTWDPSAGAASDEFECLIAARRATTGGHGNQSVTIEVDDPGASPGRSIWDGEAAGTNYQETATDDVDVSDTVAAVKVATQTVTEAADLTDLVARVASAVRSVSEATGITDLVTVAKAVTIEVTESLGITDDVQSQLLITEAVVEALGITDTVTKVSIMGRSVTEPVGVTDVVARVIASARSVSEAVGITDQATVAKAIQIVISDVVGLTDDVIDVLTPGGTGLFETVTDLVGATDSTTAVKMIQVEIADTVGLTDQVGRLMVLSRAIVESIGITDPVVRIATAVRALIEAVGITDTVSTVFVGTTFWTPDPVAYTPAPVAYTPAAPDQPPPW